MLRYHIGFNHVVLLGLIIASLFVICYIPIATATDDQEQPLSVLVSQTEVNVNRASVDELQQLSGIGANKAEAIIHYRQQYGEFKTIEDLMAVDGIGPGLLEKIRTQIRLS